MKLSYSWLVQDDLGYCLEFKCQPCFNKMVLGKLEVGLYWNAL